MLTAVQEIAKLRQEIEGLRAEVCYLRNTLKPDIVFPLEWRLSPSETAVLAAISSRPVTTREQLMEAVAGHRFDDAPDDKIIDVWISKLRRKLAGTGVEIVCRKRVGWSLTDDAREIVLARAA